MYEWIFWCMSAPVIHICQLSKDHIALDRYNNTTPEIVVHII